MFTTIILLSLLNLLSPRASSAQVITQNCSCTCVNYTQAQTMTSPIQSSTKLTTVVPKSSTKLTTVVPKSSTKLTTVVPKSSNYPSTITTKPTTASNSFYGPLPYNCNYGYQGKYCDKCGVTYSTPNLKIVGGIQAIANSWPAEVFIYFNLYQTINGKLAYGGFYCAGTLVTRDTVISAGHCVSTSVDLYYVSTGSFATTVTLTAAQAAQYYRIGLGANNNYFNNFDGTWVNVSQVIQHPKYSSVTYLNDISIFKLANSVNLTNKIQIGCLPPNVSFPTSYNIPMYSMGWGANNTVGTQTPNVLLNVKMIIYDPSKCSRFASTNWTTQLCAGNITATQGNCFGDSGGGIYVQGNGLANSTYIVAGIVSYGGQTCANNYPNVYTKISAYLPWIFSYF